ncbi:MAG: uridine kinase [Candidatus Neomarinimicrobiota bacterium]
MKSIILGVAGGTGSGKTYIVSKLLDIYSSEHITTIGQDSYYKDLKNIDYSNRKRQNFDHPDSIDIELFEKQLKQISIGLDINIPIYDFSKHVRLSNFKTISQCKIIIVEGLFALHYSQLRKLYTMKIFIDTPEKVRFKRRLNRDVKERGRTIKSVKKQYQTTVLPMHKKFIAPSKKHADVIINGDNDSIDSIDNIKVRIDSLIL